MSEAIGNQTQAALASGAVETAEQRIGGHDRDMLRRLAGRVAELAARPVEQEKRQSWYRHNDLQPTRPLIFCDPENGWNEIIRASDLGCRGEKARRWEMSLRKEIFWAEQMGDDRVIEPLFDVPYVGRESDWGMHEQRIGGHAGGSYTWEAPLKDYRDLDKLHFPRIEVDREATARQMDLAREVLGDLLQVRLRARWWWTLGMTWTLVNLRGMQQIMLDMLDCPEDLKRLMAFLRDGHLAKLDFLESHGLLSPNHDGSYVGSGGFGCTRQLPKPGYVPDQVRTSDMWGFCESQETVGVSPEMFAEFIFPFQLPILNRFGLNCYGCCEPLHARWPIIQQTPNLRRVSVSPWADLATMAEQLGDRFILSYKPRPSDLAVPNMNEELVRTGLRQVLQVARGCRLEIIMKDNHTLGGNPANATRWCQIAREEIARQWGDA